MALALDSLEIRNFRGLKHVSIETLGRVNLIVGKNNIGKTSMLEAVKLWAAGASPYSLLEILESRAQFNRRDPFAAAPLFYGARPEPDPTTPITIGSLHRSQDRVAVRRCWTVRQDGPDGTWRRVVVQDPISAGQADEPEESLAITAFGGTETLVPVDSVSKRLARERIDKVHPSTFVAASGLSDEDVGPLWDAVALTDSEQDVLAGLKIIAPHVERLTLVGERVGSTGKRTMMARIEGDRVPIPLKAMGGGMNRILGLTLGLVNARDGVALVDEVENGVHYSVQTDLWRLILQVARRLNIQVFATSHSWDSINAFQVAAREDDEADGVLLRLESRAGAVRSVPFDESELEIATREHMEVR